MTHDKVLLALFGLKYNPFLPDLPKDDLWLPPGCDLFLTRIEQLVATGGYGLITGEPGLGKSKLLQLIDTRLGARADVSVGILQRPQSSLSDLYRELGDLFGLKLAPTNRYGSFKALRERWVEHCRASLCRPLLLIDEAQQTPSDCLTELRLLCAERFDSSSLLTVVLAGDSRLPERFRHPELLPLGSRIRVRLTLEPLAPEVLLDFIEHALDRAGAPHLMTEPLKHALASHAAGSLRILTHMGAELLAAGASQNLPVLDEKLFISLYSQKPPQKRARQVAAGGGL